MRTLTCCLLFLSAAALMVRAQEKPATAVPDLSGKSDASIREVLRIVARHQREKLGPVPPSGVVPDRPPMKDGDYTPVDTLAAAGAVRMPEGIAWNYPWGVCLYGIMRSVDATGDQEMLDWALEHNRIVARQYAWLESVHRKVGDTAEWKTFIQNGNDAKIKIAALLRLGNLDNCGAMGAQILEGMARHPEQILPGQKLVVERVANWIADRQERLPDGTFWRPESRDNDKTWPIGTIWADDLYMSCPFLIRWAAYTQNGKHLTDAAHQIMNMAARLQDTDGVWFHAYSVPLQQHSPYKWGRANGWIVVTTAEVLSVLPENHPDRAALLDIYRRHVAGLKKLQPASGVWHNLLDNGEIWEETSCTAMFAYAIARGVNRGWLPPEDLAVARKAFAGICANYLTPEGVMNGTVRGTGIGMNVAYYAGRERFSDDLHGRGTILLAGTEILSPGHR